MISNLFLIVVIFSSLMACQENQTSNLKDFQIKNNNSYNVIDGQVVTEGQSKAARSVVALELLNQNQNVVGNCTGVLIGTHTVLTAAHCFSQKLVPGVVGFNVIFETQWKSVKSSRRLQGFSFTTHPQYNTQFKKWIFINGKYVESEMHPEYQENANNYSTAVPQGDHDLAVLVFKGTHPSGYEAIVIDKDSSADYRGKMIYFYGYGRAKDYIDQDGNHNDGTGQLRKGNAIVDSDFNRYPDRYFTAKGSKNSLCQGDSGGPQFFHENGVLKLIGINSAVAVDEDSVQIESTVTPGLLSCRGRSQVAKVAPFADWIKSVEHQLLKEMN